MNIDDDMVITKLCDTLPPEYKHFRSAWDSVPTENQTMDNLTSRLVMEESRLKTDIGRSEAFLAKQRATGQKSSSQKSSKQKSSQKSKAKKQGCFHCGSNDHWKKDCKEAKKSSKETKSTSSKDEKEPDSKVFFSNVNVCTSASDIWYSDSGATDHMSKNREWFRDFVEFSKPKVITLGNGSAIHALGRGSIDILSYNGTKWIEKTLANALYVPKLCANLFSESRALDNGHEIHSRQSELHVLDGDNIVAVGARRGGLF